MAHTGVCERGTTRESSRVAISSKALLAGGEGWSGVEPTNKQNKFPLCHRSSGPERRCTHGETQRGANLEFFLQKSFHSFGDGSSREAGHYVRVTDEGVTADARGRPWGPWGGTCPTPGQNNGDFIPWHALSAYSRDTAPRFWR